MSLFGSLKTLNIKIVFFRRDVETFFYSGKPFPLPAIKTVNTANISEFRKNYPFNFIKNANETEAIREILNKTEDKTEILIDAEAVVNNIFDFPSETNKYLGSSIKWNSDYLSEYEWKVDLTWKYDYFNFPQGTDIVNPWLVGRLNQLIFLGKGYIASGEEKYASKFKELLKQFMEYNPFCAGVNWTDSGEVSIRLLNIIFGLSFFSYSDIIDEEFFNDIRKYILLHSVYVENNLPEDKDYSYFISIAALTASGLVLKDSFYGEKLLRFSLSRSEEIMKKCFSTEGVPFIRSISYFPHIIEALIIIKLSFYKAGINLSELFREKYSNSFDVLASLIRDDNSVAEIGDTFIRRILPFSNSEILTYKFPLSSGCVEFNKGYLKNFVVSAGADVLFYYGKQAFENYPAIVPKEYKRISYGYTHSGIFVLRNDDIHLTVDAADIGNGGSKTAGHNDILSFELFYKGHRIIVDSGTFSIYSDAGIRNRFRSVKSHNTIYIDDEEPVELEGVSGIKEDLTKPKITEWHSDEYEDILSVQHYAYARFADPVIIKRVFRLLKEKNKIIIRDELFGGSSHQAFINLIFHPDIALIQEDKNKFRFNHPAAGEILFTTIADIMLCSMQDSVYSPSYGILSNTKKLTTVVTSKLPVYITTEITLK